MDSVVLLSLLATHVRKSSKSRARLRAVHVHHGLHANADKWSAHCATLAKSLGVPLTTLRVKVARVRGASVEAAARNARYEALANTLEAGEVLLTAHHEGDQLETVFLQLMRGAGIAGLAAMPDVASFARGMLARPLLTRSRAELEAWANANELTWMDDDTNANEQFDRNYLRRQVLPLIRVRWPSAARSVSRAARHAAEAKRLLDALALADIERAANGAALSVHHLRALSSDRRRNAVRFWIARAGHTLPDTTRLDEITSTLLDARPDANPFVEWNGVRVARHADQLSIRAATTTGGTLSVEPDPHGPVDLDALPAVLDIRQRVGGERLRPQKGGPMKTLKSLLQEARVPPDEREHLPLVFKGERLIVVADRWFDESIQATQETRRRGRIRWHR